MAAVANDGAARGARINDNGCFQVAQRGTTATGITTSGYRTADRWQFILSSLGTWTETIFNNNQAAPPFPAGNFISHLCTTTDVSPAAGDYAIFRTFIEGLDVQHLRFGSAAALPVTVSFLAASNVAGTLIVEVEMNSSGGGTAKNCSQAVSIVTNGGLFKRYSVMFPPNTADTLANDVLTAFNVNFWLAAGSTYAGGGALQTTWGTTTNARAVGQTNWAAATNNVLYLSEVQVEAGPVATSYELRSFKDEFERARRWFQRWTQPPLRGLAYDSSHGGRMGFPLPVRMRIAPTATKAGAGDWNAYDGLSTSTVDTILTNYSTADVCEMDLTYSSAFTAAGRVNIIYQSGTGYLDLSAE
jgi:hypothetical protein